MDIWRDRAPLRSVSGVGSAGDAHVLLLLLLELLLLLLLQMLVMDRK